MILDLGWVLNLMIGVFIRDRRGRSGHRDRGGLRRQRKKGSGVLCHKPRNTWELEEAREDSLLGSWQGSMALLTP